MIPGTDLAILKTEFSSSVLHDCLQKIESQADYNLLDVEGTMIIIKNVIPVYLSLSKNSQGLLVRIIARSFSILSQIVEFTQRNLQQNQKQKQVFKLVLKDVLYMEVPWFYNYIENVCGEKSVLLRRSVRALLFGSKLFNLLSEEVSILEYLSCLSVQWEYLINDFLKIRDNKQVLSILGDFLSAVLGLHRTYASDIILGELFFRSKQYFDCLLLILKNASLLEKDKIIRRAIFPYLELRINNDNTTDIQNIFKSLQIHDMSTAVLLQLKSLPMQMILLKISSHDTILSNVYSLLQILKEHADGDDEKQDTQVSQLTVFSLELLKGSPELGKISHSDLFLNMVTQRLNHSSSQYRERTMFIAKVITGQQLKFESSFEIRIPDLNIVESRVEIDFDSLKIPESSGRALSTKTNPIEASSLLEDVMLPNSDDEVSESEMDSDDETATVKSKRHIVFLKDLLKEYESGGEKESLPLFQQTVRLVRQKQYFQAEVEYYSYDLMMNVATLNNSFDEKDFEQWRINALVSIAVVVPQKIADMFTILFNSELSLQQRMAILSSIGMAARELRGIDDKNIVKPNYDFPTKKLPELKTRDSNSNLLVEEAGQYGKADDQFISNGRTKWRSKKLDTVAKPIKKLNHFRKFAALFFYPLAHGWLNGIDLGAHNKLFKTHYLTTLRIVYTCAYPVSNYESISALMQQIVVDAAAQGIDIE
ncbi:Tel2p KNAG_0B01050 [Huiozyma naganishii CBS 8797]|uniref:Telomere length regulation protein conserved domain-containing protein n=1 Tax=Huiozyma naganishii (strain ATCC MYA-139 / BCRC 22969 / CBS 8797 / KCTC 17520 / NBRC 10181 / NCYC 3082 / Yp74L-3) TaxID=1071383 RepID=J7RUN6_HUIN7|nr:hypothetical protein KNAG_0B01050 [Kazachstania naganishii CBS 8797]CCK68552.1 hypothetical protein KNAG_0B01050 [Kazachstania naganishii CBS 8797]